jgi:hypothetical protein
MTGASRRSPCRDCGHDTTPRRPREYDDEYLANYSGQWEFYAVNDHVWRAAGMPADDPTKRYGQRSGGFLCIGCLEARLGRILTRQDFSDARINDLGVYHHHTDRLRDRLTREN